MVDAIDAKLERQGRFDRARLISRMCISTLADLCDKNLVSFQCHNVIHARSPLPPLSLIAVTKSC